MKLVLCLEWLGWLFVLIMRWPDRFKLAGFGLLLDNRFGQVMALAFCWRFEPVCVVLFLNLPQVFLVFWLEAFWFMAQA